MAPRSSLRSLRSLLLSSAFLLLPFGRLTFFGRAPPAPTELALGPRVAAERTYGIAGITGAGKSTAACIMSGTQAFNATAGVDSQTMTLNIQPYMYNGTHARVCDMMGLFDTRLNPVTLMKTWCNIASSEIGDIDCWIYCLPFRRFTAEQSDSLVAFENFCGSPEVWRHTLLLVTHCGSNAGSTAMEELLKSTNPSIQRLLGKVGAVRCVELLEQTSKEGRSWFRGKGKKPENSLQREIHEGIQEVVSNAGGVKWTGLYSQAPTKVRDANARMRLLSPELKDAPKRLLTDVALGRRTFADLEAALKQAEDQMLEQELRQKHHEEQQQAKMKRYSGFLEHQRKKLEREEERKRLRKSIRVTVASVLAGGILFLAVLPFALAL